MATKNTAWLKDAKARMERSEKEAAQALRNAMKSGARLPEDLMLAGVDLLAADEILDKARAAAEKDR